MADNIGYTPGTGATIAADEIAGILHQRIKIGIGENGTATDVSEANPMPVMAVGDLLEALQSMSFALESLTRTIGLAQVNPLNGNLYVDGSRVTQPISGNIGTVSTVSTVSTVATVTNMSQLGGQNANSLIPAFERNAADNLLNFITIT
jgi:hypothetical protein